MCAYVYIHRHTYMYVYIYIYIYYNAALVQLGKSTSNHSKPIPHATGQGYVPFIIHWHCAKQLHVARRKCCNNHNTHTHAPKQQDYRQGPKPEPEGVKSNVTLPPSLKP